MAYAAVFLLGVANFAFHSAMMMSNHPMVVAAMRAMERFFGRNVSFVFEYGVLVAALLSVTKWPGGTLALYVAYTATNAVGCWLIQRDS